MECLDFFYQINQHVDHALNVGQLKSSFGYAPPLQGLFTVSFALAIVIVMSLTNGCH